MEVESALVHHKDVAEAAVVAAPHEIKGEGVHAFVTLKASARESDTLNRELREWVSKEIGSLARPEQIIFVSALPKTRSALPVRSNHVSLAVFATPLAMYASAPSSATEN